MHRIVLLLMMPSVLFSQSPYRASRTSDGKPDLQGIWIARNAASFDVTEIAEGHAIPYLPEALEREAKADRVDPIAHCAMPGVPRIVYMPFPFEIMQRPGLVVFLYEYLHNHRVIQTTRATMRQASICSSGIQWLVTKVIRWSSMSPISGAAPGSTQL